MAGEDDLRRLLSPARLRPYEEAAARDGCLPLDLYAWNVRVSAAFFENLHYVEVALRNTLDDALQQRFGRKEEWFDEPRLLSPRSLRAVDEARRRAGHGVDRPELRHGKTVAELPFGFWWSLLADEYNRTLWQPALRHAFAGSVRRRTLDQRLDELRRLRNRIAHHEPIHTRDLDAEHRVVLDVAGRRHPVLAAHLASTSRVPEALKRRPPSPPPNGPRSGDAQDRGS